MTKQELYRFTAKVYSRLRDDEFVIKFRKIRGAHGLCYKNEKWIEIDPKKEVISTLMHEMAHDIYPDLSETRIIQLEAKIMKILSVRQISKLLRELADALDRCH